MKMRSALLMATLLVATPARAQISALSSDELAAGFVLLFNGSDLSGWRGFRKAAPGEGWVIENGALKLERGGAGDIMTSEAFGPFELRLEWRISEGGNSGVIYLVSEAAGPTQTYMTGPEMQVLDDERHPDGRIPSHRAGALYDLVAPPAGTARPVGSWNDARVVFTGSSIEHWLNGVMVARSTYRDEAWRAMVATSKFRTMPLFGQAETGHIALQDHGDPVWYRNIRIRRLPAPR
jgi:hypothetical protein